MRTIKSKNMCIINEIILSPKTWERLKKEGDKELYKKYNKYADYSELRIYFNDDSIDLEAHCIKEKTK